MNETHLNQVLEAQRRVDEIGERIAYQVSRRGRALDEGRDALGGNKIFAEALEVSSGRISVMIDQGINRGVPVKFEGAVDYVSEAVDSHREVEQLLSERAEVVNDRGRVVREALDSGLTSRVLGEALQVASPTVFNMAARAD